MRNKVVLIKGFRDISPKITVSAFERINADHVVIMTALRFPQLLPDQFCDFTIDLKELSDQVVNILKHWEQEDCCHIASAEYANVVVDRVGRDVKSVEGNSLTVPWFYDTIRSYHKHFGQTVIDCEIINDQMLVVDRIAMPIEDAIFRLATRQSLG